MPPTAPVEAPQPEPPDSPPSHTRQWYVDEIVVATFAVMGFAGGVFLPLVFGFDKVPPISVSFLLATGLAALTYKYLGGIQGASFTVGTLKLGGALAALVGIAMLINHSLASQVQPPSPVQVWELSGNVTDANGVPIQQLTPDDFKLSPSYTVVHPDGGFEVSFYTSPTITGSGIDYPWLTIGPTGFDADSIHLDPAQLKQSSPAGFQLNPSRRTMSIHAIELKAAPPPPAYNPATPPPAPANQAQLAAYAAAAKSPQTPPN